MAKKRTVTLTVFGILNLVVGGLGLLGTLCGGILTAAGAAQPGGPNAGFDAAGYQKHLEANIPGLMVITWITVGVNLILYLVLIGAGIALLQQSTAGRWLSIGYCIVELLLVVASSFFQLAVVAPVVDDWMQRQPPQGRLPSWLLIGGTVAGTCPCLGYSTVLLVFMLLPSTGKAFARDSKEDFQGSLEDDYYDADYRRDHRDLPPES